MTENIALNVVSSSASAASTAAATAAASATTNATTASDASASTTNASSNDSTAAADASTASETTETPRNPILEPLPEAFYTFNVGDPVSVTLGTAIDPQGGDVTVKVDFGQASEFLKFEDNVISGSTTDKEVGEYSISINLTA